MDDHKGRGPDLKRPAQDGARVQDHRRGGPAGRLLIAQEMIPGVQIQDVKALHGMVRKAPVQIIDHGTGGRQNGPLGQGKPKDVKLGGAHPDKQLRDSRVVDGLGDGLCRCSENAREGLESVQQRRRPVLA